MKTIGNLLVAFALIFLSSYTFADSFQFQVRLALDGKEAQAISHEVFPYTAPNGQDMEIAVAKDIILSAEDVQDASIRLQEDSLKELPDSYWTMGSDGYKELRYAEEDKLNLTAEPRIEFNLTENGRKKFADFTKNNLRKTAVVIGNNRILAKVMIMEPIQSGRIQISSPTDKVNEMVKLVESMGLKLKAKPADISR